MCDRHDPEPAKRKGRKKKQRKKNENRRQGKPKKGSRQHEAEYLAKFARKLDYRAFRLARGRPALDLALGEIFLRLSEGDRLLEINRAKRGDYTVEDVGLPRRYFYSFAKLARGLQVRPILKKAVMAGAVSTLKALTVMPLAVEEHESMFTAAAMEMTVDQLKALVKAGGGTVEDEDALALHTMRFTMTPEQQDRLDAAVSLAKELEGYDAPPWKLDERIARDYLSDHRTGQVEVPTAKAGEKETAPVPSPEEKKAFEKWFSRMERRKDEISRQLQTLFEAREFVERGPKEGETALGLRALAKQLARRRERFTVPLCRVLSRISQYRLWWWLGYRSFEEYCRERLGMSPSTAREKIRLGWKLRELPELSEALISGRLTYTKALEVARHATRADVEQRIADAATTTHQQTKQDADREEEQKDRERGERKARGPAASLEVLTEAITTVRQESFEEGEEIETGEARARLGDIFFEKWAGPLKRAEWRTEWEKDVMLRHGGLCAVPGCTRAAKHLHHIVFRSKNGPHIPSNGLATCWAHHELCIHRGRLTVRGRGGIHLVWVFHGEDPEKGELYPDSEWETWGADEVRRRGLGPAA
jgi:hypothetical protein